MLASVSYTHLDVYKRQGVRVLQRCCYRHGATERKLLPHVRQAQGGHELKILGACEESQAVTIEMRRLGHEAYSCDIEPCKSLNKAGIDVIILNHHIAETENPVSYTHLDVYKRQRLHSKCTVYSGDRFYRDRTKRR